MNHINKLVLIFAVGMTLCVSSCSDGIEKLTPGDPVVNYFEVDPSDKSLNGNLRRDFYQNTGVYLLFNDVLATYTDPLGIERVEKVDFGWGIDSDDSLLRWSFDELSDEEKQIVCPLISKFLIPYINVKDGNFKPYSVMLVKNLYHGSVEYGLKKQDYISCIRCFGIDVSEWCEADDEYAYTLGRKLLITLIKGKLSTSTPELAPFFDICEECYDAKYVSRYFEDWADNPDVTRIYELGFLTYYPDSWGDIDYDTFPYENTDLRLYIEAVCGENEMEFKEKWSDYPLIIQKYNIMKECIENLGVDFNAVRQ